MNKSRLNPLKTFSIEDRFSTATETKASTSFWIDGDDKTSFF